MDRTSPLFALAKRVDRAIPPALNPRSALRQRRARREMRGAAGDLQLHLGCGAQHKDGFINIDMKITPATDYVGSIAKLPCACESVSRIESYHVIEHIPHPVAQDVVAEWARVLKPGGTMVMECPDFDEDVRKYLAGDEEMLGSIYGWQRYDGDTHYYGYNQARLTALLTHAGFSQVRFGEPEDYHARTEPCLRVEAVK
jgi:predicted SAM-dependent methyltransferase